MLIHDNAHLGATLLHGLQQLRDGRALGHGRQLANLPIAHGRVLGHVHEVLGVHEADDAVLRAVAHRVARVLILAHDVPVLFQRVFQIQTDDVGARGHDPLGVFVAQIEDVVDELVLLRIDEAAFRGLVNEQLDLLAGVHLVLVGRVVAEQAHDSVGDAVEDDHDWVGDAVEHAQGTGGVQGVLLGGEDGEGLRDELADHYVQGGHDEEAHGHADGVHRRLGEAPGQKRCFQNGGDGRLAQPADGQRCQRDAELAGRQVGVDVRGYVAGGLGAAALLGDGHVNLALAHAHQREFRDDEERVHQQEEHHEQQAYSGLHTDQSSFQGKNSVPHYRGAGDNMSESIDDFPKQSPN